MIELSEAKYIEKPWGHEEILEHNDQYVMKLLCVKKTHSLSLQYHEVKKETIYVASGSLILTWGKNQDSLKQKNVSTGDFITLEPFTLHRLEALEDSVCVEASTPQLNDVVRIEDRYKRQ